MFHVGYLLNFKTLIDGFELLFFSPKLFHFQQCFEKHIFENLYPNVNEV